MTYSGYKVGVYDFVYDALSIVRCTGCNVYDERDDEYTECSIYNMVYLAYILLYQHTGIASLPCND